MKNLLVDEAANGRNYPIEASSAGTHALNGNAPSEHAVQAAAKHGIDIGYYRSRFVTEEIIDSADLILTMEYNHKVMIQRFRPSFDYIFELKRFGRDSDDNRQDNFDVIDPIGMGLSQYLLVFDELTREIHRVFPKIVSLMETR